MSLPRSVAEAWIARPERAWERERTHAASFAPPMVDNDALIAELDALRRDLDQLASQHRNLLVLMTRQQKQQLQQGPDPIQVPATHLNRPSESTLVCGDDQGSGPCSGPCRSSSLAVCGQGQGQGQGEWSVWGVWGVWGLVLVLAVFSFILVAVRSVARAVRDASDKAMFIALLQHSTLCAVVSTRGTANVPTPPTLALP